MPRRSRPGQGRSRSGDSGGSGGGTAKLVVVWGSDPPRDQCHHLSLPRGRLQGFAASLVISPLLAPTPPARRQRPAVALWRRRGLCPDGSHWRDQGQQKRELGWDKASGPNQTRACNETGWRTWRHCGGRSDDPQKEVAAMTSDNKIKAMILALRKRLERLDQIALRCSAQHRLDPRSSEEILGYNSCGLPS